MKVIKVQEKRLHVYSPLIDYFAFSTGSPAPFMDSIEAIPPTSLATQHCHSSIGCV